MTTSTTTTATSSQAPLRCSLLESKATATSKPMPINVYMVLLPPPRRASAPPRHDHNHRNVRATCEGQPPREFSKYQARVLRVSAAAKNHHNLFLKLFRSRGRISDADSKRDLRKFGCPRRRDGAGAGQEFQCPKNRGANYLGGLHLLRADSQWRMA